MRFSPQNTIVGLCLRGQRLEEEGQLDAALQAFRRAWDEATDDHERFLAAYHLSRLDPGPDAQLAWLERALHLATALGDPSVRAAFPLLHARLSACHTHRGDPHAAARHRALAASFAGDPTDPGPFFHGTRAAVPVGGALSAGNPSNYVPDLHMRHVYFTALLDGAGLAAALSRGEGPERVYRVEPTGPFEDDPNVTNQRFPGNPTRSYRSQAPLRVLGEVADWERPDPALVEAWRVRLAALEGTVID